MMLKVVCFYSFLSAALFSLASSDDSNFQAVMSFSGTFQLQVKNQSWLWSSVPYLVSNGLRYSLNQSWTSSEGQLPPMDRELRIKTRLPNSGEDKLGKFKGFKYVYYADDVQMDLGIRAYKSFVVFSQTFPLGLSNPKVPDERQVLSGWPAIQWYWAFSKSGPSAYLSFYKFQHYLNKWYPFGDDFIPSGVEASGPIVFFNESSQDAIVVSPLTQVMHVSSWHRKWALKPFATDAQSYWGPDSSLKTLPPGFKVEVILLYSSQGVGKALEDWGAIYREYNRPPQPDKPITSVALDKLGYWSGQGSYYYKNTLGSTYENVLYNVNQSADSLKVPVGFYELDDWWFESADNNGTGLKAMSTWDANATQLPAGLRAFQENLSMPLAAVMTWWDASTPYAAQNNGSYAFLIDGQAALPMEKQFWSDLFGNASEQGVSHVFLDGVETQYLEIPALLTQVGLASDWLRNMSTAAYDAGITLTLSQAYPRILMEASQYPSVVQARVSRPYLDGSVLSLNQWQIGVDSLLPRALGLAAFKDTFWGQFLESGNPYGDQGEEPDPVTQAVVATLSTGSVVIGDRVDLLQSAATSRCCRSDGVILKPSKPIAAIDSQLKRMLQEHDASENPGHMWATVSSMTMVQEGNVTSSLDQGVILVADMWSNFTVTPSMAFPGLQEPSAGLMSWSWNGGQVMFWAPFSELTPLSFLPGQCSMAREPALPCLFYVSTPISLRNGDIIVYLGGEDKIVPLSPQRVQLVTITDDVTLTLMGEPDEHVTMFYYVNNQKRQFDVVISFNGTSEVTLDISNAPMDTTSSVPETTETSQTTTDSGVTSVTQYASLATYVIVASFSILLKRTLIE